MAEKKQKFSACHNAAVHEKNGDDHCSVCGKPCKLADPSDAIAAHKQEGRSAKDVLAGRPADAGKKGAAPVESEEDEDGGEPDDEDDLPGISAKMKRADLEKIAAEEGIDAEAIKGAETNKDLVQLIQEERDEDGDDK